MVRDLLSQRSICNNWRMTLIMWYETGQEGNFEWELAACIDELWCQRRKIQLTNRNTPYLSGQQPSQEHVCRGNASNGIDKQLIGKYAIVRGLPQHDILIHRSYY